MGSHYCHLKLDERRKIAKWLEAKMPIAEIADRLGREATTSSKRHLSAAVGRPRLTQRAKCRPNRFTHLRKVSRPTITPRSASRSSTSAVLSAKRWYAHTA